MADAYVIRNVPYNYSNRGRKFDFEGENNGYPVGGLPLDSVLLALPESTTNSGVRRCILTSDVGSGYIWQRIPATGKMMGLQVPPTGSLTTAAPLQQLPSTVSDLTLQNEAINFQVEMLRNA
jgi:hypothetical protein